MPEWKWKPSSSLVLLWLWCLATPVFNILVLAQESTVTETPAASAEAPPLIASVTTIIPYHKIDPNFGDKDATDKDENCDSWAEEGECFNNPTFMVKTCPLACRNEKRKAVASVFDGEDASVGAFRFAEEYLAHSFVVEEQAVTTQTILLVAKQLQDALVAAEYTPPKDLTHCGKRACSAGKLWKRAEEMRQADMHDAAGADMIRALQKSGLEVDFMEKCQKMLHWAFGSVERQRERERKQAEEDAKLEERMERERLAMQAAQARKEEYEADFVKFGTKAQELLTKGTATVETDGTVHAESEEVVLNVIKSYVEAGPQGTNFNETIQLIKKIPGSAKSAEILLIEARCHEMLGNHKSALSAAGRLIQKGASYDPWVNDSPRMMAATLGANAAMQLGLSENALSFYQTVLKFDPEQERARKQYRGLKKVVKLLDKAEEQIQKGYNKAASVHIDDCLSAIRGLDVDSPLFRSKIQLQQCTILSAMGKYEEALGNCDSAVEIRVANDVAAASKKEAYLARAEALLQDMDYDEAVQDLRAALELLPDHNGGRDESAMMEKRELEHKLRQTMHQQDMWNGGAKDNRYNDHTGYPDGRPPQRDHAKILQLPIDLEERSKEIKCAWLKKQFKSLVRKFHPDKYKGNKKRAARKFKEVKEAKEIISGSWGCSNRN